MDTTDATSAPALPKHRLEALADGIFAVAMTLLVIELKLPESPQLRTAADLQHALVELVPRLIAWVISFFVLALFWASHQRLFRWLRAPDGRLVALALLYLGVVSLMPFASALAGQYGGALIAQVVYCIVMGSLGIAAWLQARYVYRHPQLCIVPMSAAEYHGARIRTLGLIAVAACSLLLAWALPGRAAIGNFAFLLMVIVTRYARRVERPAATTAATT